MKERNNPHTTRYEESTESIGREAQHSQNESNERRAKGHNGTYSKTEKALAFVALPHISEELWHQLGNNSTIHIDNWPEWDEKYLIENTVTVIVQINGKLRAKLELSPEASEEEAIAAAKAHEKIAPLLSTTELKRAIYIKGRVVNLVI